MQILSLNNSFLAFSFVAIASFISACSPNTSQNQTQVPNTIANDVTDKQQMKHGMAMDLGSADANFDLRFIDAMIPHHQGAIEMATQAQEKSKRPQIKKLANDIITAQNKEIQQMQQWRKAWYPKAGDKPMAYDAQMGHMMEMSSSQIKGMMMKMDLGTGDADFDLRFINAMIPHHESAVIMGKDALNKSGHPEIKQLALNIIKSQDAEISQMKQWRKAWYDR